MIPVAALPRTPQTAAHQQGGGGKHSMALINPARWALRALPLQQGGRGGDGSQCPRKRGARNPSGAAFPDLGEVQHSI